MSKVIEPQRIATGDLSDEEVLYLAQRGQLDESVLDEEQREALRESLDGSAQSPPHAFANTGTMNTAGESIEDLERRLARMKEEQAAHDAAEAMTREVRRQRRPITADDPEDGPEEDDEDDEDAEPEDYSTERGWTNDSRRGELSRRGLSVDGDKAELIGRLMADDAKED